MTVPYGPILVVEDVPNIRDLLQVTLTFKGYPVITARDGMEALEKIKIERPALIISDVLMPNLDGFALVHQLRTNALTNDIPIILISATYIQPEDRKFAMELGAVRFLEKPVDTDEFLLTVAEILTQGPPSVPAPLSSGAFFKGYRERLEDKLQQKNRQIERTKRLLDTLPKEQVSAFEALLDEEYAHKATIRSELDDLYKILDDNKKG